MSEVIGYSERGLVNALFESIVASKKPQEVLTRILVTATSVANRVRVNKFRVDSPIRDFKVFIEPSLSNFGNPDAVILLETEPSNVRVYPPRKHGQYSDAIFIEAKIDSFRHSLRNYDPSQRSNTLILTKNSSSILHQLFLKARFEYYLRNAPEKINKGHPVYQDDIKKPRNPYNRNIGSDPVVLDLVKQIQDCADIRFVALTTDRCVAEGSNPDRFPTGTYIHDMQEQITSANREADSSLDEKWSYRWEKLTYLLSWHDVFAEAKGLLTSGESSMHRLLDTIEWNITKFRFPTLDNILLVSRLEGLKDKLGCIINPDRKNKDYRTLSKADRARFTCRIADSFEGPTLEALLFLPNKKRQKVKILFTDIDRFLGSAQASNDLKDLIQNCM